MFHLNLVLCDFNAINKYDVCDSNNDLEATKQRHRYQARVRVVTTATTMGSGAEKHAHHVHDAQSRTWPIKERQ
jgi:hypothetical protein